MLIAVTRPVSATLASCELTHLPRQPLDVLAARRQQQRYEDALVTLGATVVRLPAADELPDAAFVEDMAVVLDEVAVIATPGAPSRVPEQRSVLPCVERFRPLRRLAEHATLEGGDVLRVGRTLYVGRSARTNDAGVTSLRAVAGEYGYDVVSVDVGECLHLKTACGYVGRGTIVANGEWIDGAAFSGLELLQVPPSEPWGANVLAVNGTVLLSEGCPRTRTLIEARGFRTMAVDISELQKAEAGLTCLSLLFESPAVSAAE